MIILVADDTEDIRLMLKLRLELRGHRVVEAADGRQAVALAASERPDVILMDLSMPVMDGIEAAKYLRARPETCCMPIIAVTAHCSDPAWRLRAADAGCVACVDKPVDFKELERLIARVQLA